MCSAVSFKRRVNKIEDYNDKEEENNQSLDIVTEEEREVFIDKSQLSIFEIHRRYRRGELDLRPSYQRKDAWNKVKKSKLIESVIRNIPIPAIYLSEREDGDWEVIDGQQRLRAFFDFLEDDYELVKLPVLSNLNNSRFSDLESRLQRKIEDSQLHIFIIRKESHPDIKFDIFQRINEGAEELNAQELRNCIFRGEGIELIRRLSKNENFIKVIGKRLHSSRCKDEEIVLRFLSFYAKGFEEYKGNLNIFLNDTLRRFSEFEVKLENIEEVFSSTMRAIYDVFGEEAFVKEGTPKNSINISLFDVITFSFSLYQEDFLLRNSSRIRKLLENSMTNREFYESISFNTLTKSSVRTRFTIWLSLMENLKREVEV